MSATNTASPDVILLICDQMQAQRLGAGSPSLTPNLDALARTGMTFERAFCSYAQCSPSRASLHTGLYPHEAGVMVIYGFGGHTGHLGPRHRTVAQVFRDAGYRTALFGKSHFGSPLAELGYQDGVERGGGPVLADVDRAITADALDYLDRDDERPTFLTVSWHQPHPPFETVPEFIDEVPEEPVPASFFDDDLSTKPPFQKARREQPGGGYELEQLRREQAQYLSMIAAMDHEVGRVLAALRERGRPAVIAFTSDHGDLMGAHGLRLKGTLPYEELYRVPLIIAAPTVEPGRSATAMTVNVDLPGTLMDLAGVPRPEAWPDRSVPGIADDRPAPGMVFMEHYGAYWGFHPFRMVRTSTHKYVRYYGPDEGQEELYDLVGDPDETRNLAHEPAHAALRSMLATTLEAWWHDTGGRDWEYYESTEFREIDAATLVADNELWAAT